MKYAIKAKNLSKIYKLYNKRVDRIKETFLPFTGKQYHRPFHALDNVSFSIERGKTVGIVGRNGSGKSTLLQIICNILQRSSGDLEVEGRISALLELGAGFNPEFTGRENVYLNASILGMSRGEVDECLGDILDFAGIGQFIDQPVKTYSSGMYVRLAFAVAINVNPDILIIDEALSVGDNLFQSKCFAKFRDFQNKGKTILFVTHSVELITRYCSSAILLDNGKCLMQGPAKDVVDAYNRIIVDCASKENIRAVINVNSDSLKDTKPQLDDSTEDTPSGFEVPVLLNPVENRYGNGKADIYNVGIRVSDEKLQYSYIHGEYYTFWVEVKFNEPLENPIVAFTIKDVKGFDVTGTNTYYKEHDTGLVEAGDVLRVEFKHRMMLNPGGYLLSFGCAGFEAGEYVVYDRRYDVISFEVVSDKLSVGLFDLDSEVSVSNHN